MAARRPPSSYHLRVQQQPSRARLCSFKEANDTIDRRPVDPPPVVEVFTTDDSPLLEATNLFIHAALVLPNASPSSDYAPAKTPSGLSATTGETIQTPEQLRMMDERSGALCVFAKLSIRMPGLFRLKFTLYQTSKLGLRQIGHTFSEPFEVFSPKLFTGMRESTMFTRHLAMQGIKVKLRTDTSAGRASTSRRRRPSPKPRSQTPQTSPGASQTLVWRDEYHPPANIVGGDDGLVRLSQFAAPSQPYSSAGIDLSSFSLNARRPSAPSPLTRPNSYAGPSTPARLRVPSSRPASPAQVRGGPHRAKQHESETPPRASNRPDSPPLALGSLNLINTGDDGMPVLPKTFPVLPHLANILGPPDSPKLPSLRLRD